VKTIKDNIFPEIGDQFETVDNMVNFFKTHIVDKHDYIIYLRDSGKYGLIKILILINNGMAISNLDYLEMKDKSYKAQKQNINTIKDKEKFNANLLR
jgi:hypothetical protein